VRKLVLKLLPSFTQDMKFMQIVLDAQWNPVSHTGKASSQSQGVQP